MIDIVTFSQSRRSAINTDLSNQLMAMNATKPQAGMQIFLQEKLHDLQNERLTAEMQKAIAAPPPGQGLSLDKQV